MNKKILIAVTMFAAFLLPAVATAAVIVNNSITVGVNFTNSNQVYMEKGPGYSSGHSAGFITMKGNNQKYTNATINIKGIPGTGDVVITNAVEIYSAVSSGTVNVWLNFNAANRSGFISIGRISPNGSDLSVDFNHPPDSNDTVLDNMLYLHAGANGTLDTRLWLNGSLPPGVSMYIGRTKMDNSGAIITGGNITAEKGSFSLYLGSLQGKAIFYISFQLKISGPENANLTVAAS